MPKWLKNLKKKKKADKGMHSEMPKSMLAMAAKEHGKPDGKGKDMAMALKEMKKKKKKMM